MRMDQSSTGIFDLQFIISEMFRDGVLQLPEKRHGLHEASSADGMSACEKSTGRIDWKLSIEGRVSFVDKAATVTIFAQAEILVGLKFARSVGVMQFDDVQIVEWSLDPGHFVSANRSGASCPERMDTGVMQSGIVRFFFMREQWDFTLRPIGEAHAITAGADAADADGIFAKSFGCRF